MLSVIKIPDVQFVLLLSVQISKYVGMVNPSLFVCSSIHPSVPFSVIIEFQKVFLVLSLVPTYQNNLFKFSNKSVKSI